MSAATSPGTGLAYGLRRVCAAWGMARSSFYAMTSGQHAEQPPAKRRGPKPAISDQALLVAIEADLEASPWEGEGYRKVWARLRVCRDIRVARKRVLRLMRENNLLSPHRCRRRGGNPHDGEIITHAPNLMWGTDGVRVFTVDDGWGWIFTAVEHWNAECVGWHVCKRGDRFAALQPISMGLAGLYGSTAAGAARGLALRMDHGSQYLSDHFTNQIKFWGIQPSYAFVAEPQTNGVAERFNRTLKEQIIHGRIYRNIAELRDAVRDFVELYNAQWIVEKNGYLSPAQARQAWHATISWGMARSSFYAMTSGQHAEQPPAKRRGPKPAISDQALLVASEADLEASPWEGEGYRKVWARLRVCRDIRVARKRVLRLMRENNLLSPHRCRRRGGNPHDGEIITHAPNLMWGTDGVRVFTVDDGWGWIFTAVEHWNAECVGWHVGKRGDRFAALQPISMGLAGLYGSTAAGAARGLALRMDHGSQYLSDHFTNQIKFWGIQPSYAFVAEPQMRTAVTN